MRHPSVTEEAYEAHRPLAFGLAYRMLGSVAEAEDVVQEAFLRLHRDEERVESPRAFVSTVVTRLAIDRLRSAQHRRETYPGEWLPEPLVTQESPPDADTISMALLVTLESLSPVERAVFLLHDVFDYGYDEIAGIVGKSRDNTRQLAVRARRHVDAGRPRFDADAEQRARLVERFFAAVGDGDFDALVSMLAEDATIYGDGGGKAPALARPLTGASRIARALLGFARVGARDRLTTEPAIVNGQPGVLVRSPERTVIAALSFDVEDGRVTAIRSVVNPDKLAHLRAEH
jgi:RNA polymerase sigma-70 factor (ECF subfamily)